MDTVLVINAGSSSVKFQVFIATQGHLERKIKGQIDGIGVRPRLNASIEAQTAADRSYSTHEIPDVPTALQIAGEWLWKEADVRPNVVGHRVVHGGPQFDRPTLMTWDALEQLTQFVPLAPLHQPYNLAPIKVLLERQPDVPQIACFDTAFHRGHDALADYYAIPRAFHDKGIRRYGFHGLSYEYIAKHLAEAAPEIAAGKVIVAHLGSGASMCAIHDGKSVDSTLGFTALDGLPMGTRPGQIDPGVVLHLIQHEGMTAKAVEEMFYKESGLKGLSGISNDVRDLLASSEPTARFALDYFCYRAAMSSAMLAGAMQGVDSVVFTAGVGENSSEIRARICNRLRWLGAELDHEANQSNQFLISTHKSHIGLYVVPTNEEQMIARHCIELCSLR